MESTDPARPVGPASSTSSEAMDTLRGLLAQAEQMTGELQLERKVAKHRHRLNAVFLAVIAALIALTVTLIVRLEGDRRQRSAQNAANVRRVEHISEQIADCTTNEKGACFQQSQRRTGALLALLRRDAVLTAIYVQQCSKVAQTDEELEQCVMRRLASATPAPTPAPSAPASPSPPS